ncbi:MAG TPA: transglycosylase domain-containing protein [Candidatus Acidoferrales bacterium]|nr:transglycosylase domain-containing protein [Candidatus Acidoferrales bacterium]
MAALYKVSLALAAVVLIAANGFCGWVFFYTGDLPKTDGLAEFAPAAGQLVTDSCLASLLFAIPFDLIGKPFQDALASAEPRISFPDQIARTLMCNRFERSTLYQLNVFRLSWHIRRRFSEKQLFTIYANRAYFGPGATGVDNASQHFFQRDANALSTEEAALLAGLLRGPDFFSPFKHPDRALQRRNEILETMASQGKLSSAEFAKAVGTPIITRSLGNTEVKPLPSGVLKALAADEAEYCDELGDEFKKGCEETFRINLMWRELPVAPVGPAAILVQNSNMGFCGTAGCALSLFIEQPDAQFAQVLGSGGDVGDLDEVRALKTITNGHYDIQKTWADGQTHTIYRWRGSRYFAD